MAKKAIDLRKDIDYVDAARKQHRKSVLDELLEDPNAFATRYQIPVASAPEGAKVTIDLPMKREYRFSYGFQPFGEQGRGVGQSGIPQEEGEGQGGEGQKEGDQEEQEGTGGQGEGQEGEGEPRLHRGMEVGHLEESEQARGQAQFGLGEGQEGEGEGQESSPDKGGVKAGRSPGEDSFETEFDVEDLRDKISDEFELPELDEKNLSLLKIKAKSYPHGYRKKGPLSQLSGDKTLEEYLKRAGGSEDADEELILPEDFRFRRKEEAEQYISNLVMYFAHDASGSIDGNKLSIIRALSIWWARAARKTHEEIVFVFITFHTKAEERTELDYIYLSSSGGTTISSGSEKVHEIKRHGSKFYKWPGFPQEEWNSMVIFLTDGENDGSDMHKMYESFKGLCEFAKFVAYYEVLASGNVISSNEIKQLDREHENFVPFSIKDKAQTKDAILAVLDALKASKKEEGYA